MGTGCESPAMKWPRKGILIRLAIYLPIIGYLTYQAFFVDRGPPAEAAAPDEPGRVRHIQGPDGKEFKVIEVTPEEARQMGVEIPEPPPSAAEAKAPADP